MRMHLAGDFQSRILDSAFEIDRLVGSCAGSFPLAGGSLLAGSLESIGELVEERIVGQVQTYFFG